MRFADYGAMTAHISRSEGTRLACMTLPVSTLIHATFAQIGLENCCVEFSVATGIWVDQIRVKGSLEW